MTTTDTPDVIRIDKRRAKQLIQATAEKRGKRARYQTCRYVDPYRDNKPGCIVGEALFIAGVPVEVLHRMDDRLGIISNYVPTKSEYPEFSLTPGAVSVFLRAQNIVDAGRTFGSAATAVTSL